MKTLKRKSRSDKFPLTLHPTGQYCKKVKGKIYYFGSDRKEALQRYLDQATYLHGCQGFRGEVFKYCLAEIPNFCMISQLLKNFVTECNI